MKIFYGFLMLLFFSTSGYAQSLNEKKDAIALVQRFFDTLKAKDTTAFRDLFVNKSVYHYVIDRGDSITVGTQLVSQVSFKRPGVITERMRTGEVAVQVHKRIAMVWAPYDLWIDEQFSHCGVDVFTLVKTNSGWKISGLTYTIEKDECPGK